jgi:hypothetical protein
LLFMTETLIALFSIRKFMHAQHCISKDKSGNLKIARRAVPSYSIWVTLKVIATCRMS